MMSASILLRLFWINYSSLFVEEAYYWNYAQHLDFGYLDHPPMIAVLIKIGTSIFGTNEFGVRSAIILCEVIALFFSIKLTNLIVKGAGIYTIPLFMILPFFFLHSVFMTPDEPLTACWAGALYCLYRALVLNQSKYWYLAGVFIGLGMLSKYSIALLGPAAMIYIFMIPAARTWLTRKEPYLGALIAALLFTPVIYWNATHEWASFAFQSTRRLQDHYHFSFHHTVGLLLFFLMPPGLVGLWYLVRDNSINTSLLEIKSRRFLQIFTLFPLSIFSLFSLTHEIKFHWIGPSLLTVIPWLAILIKQYPKHNRLINHTNWLITASVLLTIYSGIIVITFCTPDIHYKKNLAKIIAWDDLTRQVYDIAQKTEATTQSSPVLVPLDLYNIGSELAFYQAKFLADGDIIKSYPVVGGHVFGTESLMYRYWSNKNELKGKTLITLSRDPEDFNNEIYKKSVIQQSPVNSFWSHSQLRGTKINEYYYQIVQMKY